MQHDNFGIGSQVIKCSWTTEDAENTKTIYFSTIPVIIIEGRMRLGYSREYWEGKQTAKALVTSSKCKAQIVMIFAGLNGKVHTKA